MSKKKLSPVLLGLYPDKEKLTAYEAAQMIGVSYLDFCNASEDERPPVDHTERTKPYRRSTLIEWMEKRAKSE